MTTADNVFSYNLEEGHIYRVCRVDESWECSETLAKFPRTAMQEVLTESTIYILKREGWSWVEPE